MCRGTNAEQTAFVSMEYYGPRYKLEVLENNMDNYNTDEYLSSIKRRIIENLRSMPFAPSTQMREVPAQSVGKHLGIGSRDTTDARDEDIDFQLDVKIRGEVAVLSARILSLAFIRLFANFRTPFRYRPTTHARSRRRALRRLGPRFRRRRSSDRRRDQPVYTYQYSFRWWWHTGQTTLSTQWTASSCCCWWRSRKRQGAGHWQSELGDGGSGDIVDEERGRREYDETETSGVRQDGIAPISDGRGR